ncbi:amidohydrolase [Sciscionella marina]|uniref:amidohydrolase n=1 Tax=Sciscionella marina TaxID=508770 RepID=UPI00035E5856|nr:amidohydrolase [Sciscionella marina]
MPHADLVFLGGSVITVDGRDRVTEALAVVEGRIAAVGTEAEVRELCGPGTRVVELDGGAVLPGINDSHLHAFGVGLNRPPVVVDVGFPRVRSIAEVTAAVRERASELPEGTWIRGTGWDAAFLAECQADPSRSPDRADLDAATTAHPVVLEETYGHSSWLNSTALRAAGIDADTVPPPGSEVVKDPVTGEPTGLLREFGAQALVHAHLPSADREQRRTALRTTLDVLTPLGITSFTDPALGPGGDGQLGGAFHQEGIEVYAEFARSGELRARVNVLLLFGDPDKAATARDIEDGLREFRPPQGIDPARLRIGGVKIFADGIPPSRTAWMSEPYECRPDAYGSLVVGGDSEAARETELAAMIAAAHEAGYQVGTHATGDRAVDAVVAAYVAAARTGEPDPRHYVIHGDLLSPGTIATMARNRIGLNPQPAIQSALGELLSEVIGEERTARQHAMRGVLDAGVPLAFSSDAPVTAPDWRAGIAAAVLRESKASGKVIGAEHRIGVLEAIRCYTLGGAWQDHAEDWKGSLEVGKVADLCVLGADPLAVDPHELPEVPVRMTVLDGEIVYEA